VGVVGGCFGIRGWDFILVWGLAAKGRGESVI